MQNKKVVKKNILFTLWALGLILLFYFVSKNGHFAMLDPKGLISYEQKKLMLISLAIMMVVVLPVFTILVYILERFKEDGNESDYQPNLVSNKKSVFLFWSVSITTISIISILIWQTSHSLDPYKKIVSKNEPLTIQVVALNWKWLFIYPKQNLATVNYIKIPKDTPVEFKLTADAPMNTFWIPQLGGQMYAMEGMENRLNLIANSTGEFDGLATEINGKGYSKMRFKVYSTENEDFQKWINETKATGKSLSMEEYELLAKESEDNPQNSYSSVETNLFSKIMMKFMSHGSTMENSEMNHNIMNHNSH